MMTTLQQLMRQGLIVILSVCLYPMGVQAEKIQSLNEVEQVAYEFAMTSLLAEYGMPEVMVSQMDKRLRLQACQQSLQAFSPQSKVTLGQQTIGVKCTAKTPWTVYVQVTVKLMKEAVVAKKALAPRHVLTAGDLMLKRVDIGQVKQRYVTDPKLLLGYQLKYPVASGTVLSQAHVKPVKMVRRGDHVVLVAQAGSMEVKMNGVALSDASYGQRVKVKNSSSKRVVEGLVDAPGVVRVQL